MGMRGFTSNKKKKAKASKSAKWRRAVKAEKKKQLPAEALQIEDIHLFSKEKLRNKLKNPKNSVKITGKKRQRLTKRLGHSLREKSMMEFDVEDSRSRKSSISQPKDVVMKEEDGVVDITASQAADLTGALSSTSSSEATTTSKKKKRGGKKHKKKGAPAGAGVSLGDDGTEDSRMDEDDDL